jgi:hypothetical protein
MIYRLAEIRDLESIFDIVVSAILEMDKHGILQWDNIYPSKEDFLTEVSIDTTVDCPKPAKLKDSLGHPL